MTEHATEKVNALISDLQDALRERQEFMKGGGALYGRAIDALAAVSAERDAAHREVEAIITELDRARANGTIYTYGNLQHRLRLALSRTGKEKA